MIAGFHVLVNLSVFTFLALTHKVTHTNKGTSMGNLLIYVGSLVTGVTILIMGGLMSIILVYLCASLSWKQGWTP